MPAQATVAAGDTIRLSATLRNEAGEVVTGPDLVWSSSDTDIAEVNDTGRVLGVAPGSATITARSAGVTGVAILTVTPATVARVVLLPDSAGVRVGRTIQLIALPEDGSGRVLEGRAVSWSSTDDSIASVDASGLVRGEAPGKARILATVEGVSGSAVVTVAPRAVAAVTVFPDSAGLIAGTTRRLTTILTDADGDTLRGRTVAWASSDTAIARVDSSGLVTGVAEGATTVTATSEGVSGVAEIDVLAPVSFTTVEAGTIHTCGLSEDERGFCWGEGRNGQLGDGIFQSRAQPVPVSGDLRFVEVSAGGRHVCAVSGTGEAFCWGDNDAGQLGDGRGGGFTQRAVPAPVIGLDDDADVVQVTSGTSHSCARLAGGSVFCWGANDQGQLGDGTTMDSDRPVGVSTELTFATITAGGAYVCGLTGDGTPYCWGENTRGQLGDGTNVNATTPVAVETQRAFAAIAAGPEHTCALTAVGEAFCWGANERGQLGDGSTADSNVPTPVDGGHFFDSIASGFQHTCGVATDGTGLCWGWNGRGQLGTGSTEDRSLPTPIDVALGFTVLTAGSFHSCGLASDARVYCWGLNSSGQLGDGTTADRTRPVRVGGQR